MEHIKVNIKDGVLTWKVTGVKGNGCHDLTKVLKKMSSKVIDSGATPEATEGKKTDSNLTNFGG